MTRNMITIPAGMQSVPCKRAPECAIRIYWIPHPTTGRKHPVSASADGCTPPTETEDGLGVSHFADCKFAHEFRKRPGA